MAAAILLPLSLAACGGGDDNNASNAAADAAKGGVSAQDAKDAAAAGAIAGGAGKECADAFAPFVAALSQVGALMSGQKSTQATKDGIKALEAAKKSVPKEIKDDFDVWASAVIAFSTEVSDGKAPGQAATDSEIDSDAVNKAADNLQAYFEKKCGG
jgi:hypothetical protein